MLPSLRIGQGQQQAHGAGTLFVKQLKTISSSPIRNNSLHPHHPSQLRTKSADQQLAPSGDENTNQIEGSNPQSLAISRVMKSIRKQRLIQQQTEVTLTYYPTLPP